MHGKHDHETYAKALILRKTYAKALILRNLLQKH